MRGLLAAIWLLSCGCDVLFQLKTVTSIDAPGCGTPDEDGDCVADPEDVCPGFSDVGQADDGDGDGVGTVCDPNSTIAHRIVRFDGFTDPAQDAARWSSLGASAWLFADGQVNHPDVDAIGELQHMTDDVTSDLAVEAGFTFNGWRDQTGGPSLGVWIDMPAGAIAGHTCLVMPYASSGATSDAMRSIDAAGHDRAVNFPQLVDNDRVVVIAHRVRAPDVLRCRVLVNERQVATFTYPAAPMTVWPDGGRIGVRATYASASLRYVVVYAAP